MEDQGSNSSQSGSLGRRLALTLGLPLLLLLGERVPAAGLDNELIASAHQSSEHLSIFALHLMPLTTAYVVVELVALLVPKWRAPRHRWPKGRAKLERSVFAVAVVLAAIQAAGIARLVSSMKIGQASLLTSDHAALLFALTLIAGTCFLAVLASLISRQGLANGVVVLLLVAALERFIIQTGTWLENAVQAKLALEFLPLLVAAIVLGFATALTLLKSSRDAAAASLPEQAVAPESALWIPVPASPFTAVSLAAGVSMIPNGLAGSGFAPAQQLARALTVPDIRLGALTLLTSSIAIALAFALFRTERIADFQARMLSAASGSATRRGLPKALRRALVRTALLLLGLVFVDEIWRAHGLPSIALLPLLIALALDTRVGLRASAWQRGLVCIWQEQRPYAVPAIQRALAQEGVNSTVLGLSQLTAYQLFAPYLPAQILVHESDAQRAVSLLRARLRSNPQVEASAPAEPLGTR